MKIISLILISILIFGFSNCLIKKETHSKKNDSISNNYYTPLNKFQSDSSKYLYDNFIKNKKYYIDRKLELVLNNLELPVQNYLVSLSNNNLNESNAITLILTDEKVFFSNKEKKKYILLNITWKIPINGKQAFDLLEKSKTQWNNSAKEFYKNNIVKDINMVNYNP